MSEFTDRAVHGDEIRWHSTPVDPLTFDDDTRLLADTLRVALDRIVALQHALNLKSRTYDALLRDYRKIRHELETGTDLHV